MSSIATSIPTGVISGGPEWCITDLLDAFGQDQPPWNYSECANATRGTKPSDFQTFCCDGDIIDSSQSMWDFKGGFINYPLDLANLVCCRAGGVLQPGGIMPLPDDYTECEYALLPTPLASLAATNTKNAAPYLATYEGASGNDDIGYKDWVRTETPRCLWVQTTHPDVTMAEVRVPVAEITTLPPPSTDAWGRPLPDSTWGPDLTKNTEMRSTSVTEGSGGSGASSEATVQSTSSSAGVRARRIRGGALAGSAALSLALFAITWLA